jgi:hypothetical protein
MNYKDPADCYIFQKVDDLSEANNKLSKQVKTSRFLIFIAVIGCGYLLKKHHDKIETLTKEIKELTKPKGE